MEFLRKVQTRFQELVLIVSFSLWVWTSMGGVVFLLGETDASFVYFGKWGYLFISEGFKYYGVVYFLLPLFIGVFANFIVRKTESLMDLFRLWERIFVGFFGLFFLSAGISALIYTITHHYDFSLFLSWAVIRVALLET
ncbi:MAG: hypothetical protein R3A80_02680 [Bdellovibrionota bacterium]